MKNKIKLIERLKEARLQRGITYQFIVDKTEEMGSAVSMSSVKRVFGDTSDPNSFRYDDILRPIACVVLGLDFEDSEAPQEDFAENKSEEYWTEAQALRAIVEIKNQQIEELKAQLAAEKDDRRAEVTKLHEVYQAGLQDRAETKKSLMRIIVIMGVIMFVLVATLAYIDYNFFPYAGLLRPGEWGLTS